MSRDGVFRAFEHYSARVLTVVDDEWRADKLVMPDIQVDPSLLPADEHESSRVEDEDTWADLSVTEMVNAVHLTDDLENSVHSLHLDNRLFSPESFNLS
mmetsp:Transcript_3098/g.6427  ORF Transcript_3098/g.6427 Transcript_3098/m.6427 type:complete len:99 (-) Transcript_3098:887-1183(-)